jgi:hypothetical protein
MAEEKKNKDILVFRREDLKMRATSDLDIESRQSREELREVIEEIMNSELRVRMKFLSVKAPGLY